MIEIIYNDSGKNSGSVIVKPPKNIRQIGSPRGRNKIYVEDYVYTFLHSPAFEGDTRKRAAVLLGKSEVSQDIRYTFISGAINCGDFVFQGDSIIFDESCWEYIYKEIKQYFDNLEVVGWFLGMPGFPLEITPSMEAAHRKYFAGRDKVLFLSEPTEGEDAFYAYEQGILQKKEGYYIYYEKNQCMQEYMVCTREKAREIGAVIEDSMNLTSESITFPQERLILPSDNISFSQEPVNINDESTVPSENLVSFPTDSFREDTQKADDIPNDFFQEIEGVTDEETVEPETFAKSEETITQSSAEQALQNYRSMLLNKGKKHGTKKMSVFLYTAASAAMVILCVIGITTLNNYEKMKEVEETLSLISQSTEDDVPASTQPSGLVVESVPGEVTPKSGEEDTAQKEGSDSQQGADQKDGVETGAQENQAGGQGAQGSTAAEGEKNTSQDANKTDPAAQAGDSGAGAAGDNSAGGGTGAQGGGTQQGTQAPQTPEGDGTQNQTAGGDGTQSQGAEGAGAEGAKETSSTNTRETAQTYLEQGYYVVQPGDRLETICKYIYQTTAMLDKLCEANQIDDVDKIYAGQRLTLP